MIQSNLQNVLDNKNISIRELSEKTGINRASLAQLAKNESKMIKFDTLNKLIKFLNVNIYDILKPVPDISFKVSNEGVHPHQDTFDAKALFTDLTSKENHSIDFIVSAKRLDNVILMTINGSKENKKQLFIYTQAMQSVIFGGKNNEQDQIRGLMSSYGKVSQNIFKNEKVDISNFDKALMETDKLSTKAIRPLAIKLAWLLLTDSKIGNMVGITEEERSNVIKSINLHFILNMSIPEPKDAINFQLPNFEVNFTVGLKALDLLGN